jgi:hypothetical protein
MHSGGGAVSHMDLLIEPQLVSVLYMINQQLHVNDGQPHTFAGDPLLVDGSQAQARVFAKLHDSPDVKFGRKLRRPHGLAIEVRMAEVAQAVTEIESGKIAGTEINLKGLP